MVLPSAGRILVVPSFARTISKWLGITPDASPAMDGKAYGLATK